MTINVNDVPKPLFINMIILTNEHLRSIYIHGWDEVKYISVIPQNNEEDYEEEPYDPEEYEYDGHMITHILNEIIYPKLYSLTTKEALARFNYDEPMDLELKIAALHEEYPELKERSSSADYQHFYIMPVMKIIYDVQVINRLLTDNYTTGSYCYKPSIWNTLWSLGVSTVLYWANRPLFLISAKDTNYIRKHHLDDKYITVDIQDFYPNRYNEIKNLLWSKINQKEIEQNPLYHLFDQYLRELSSGLVKAEYMNTWTNLHLNSINHVNNIHIGRCELVHLEQFLANCKFKVSYYSFKLKHWLKGRRDKTKRVLTQEDVKKYIHQLRMKYYPFNFSDKEIEDDQFYAALTELSKIEQPTYEDVKEAIYAFAQKYVEFLTITYYNLYQYLCNFKDLYFIFQGLYSASNEERIIVIDVEHYLEHMVEIRRSQITLLPDKSVSS
jgi:hypothetical protein